MAGEIKIFKHACSVSITTEADSIATVTGVEHHFVSNGQIQIGQTISFSGYTGTVKVSNVEDVIYSGNRRTKVTFDGSVTINNGTTVTFNTLDGTFKTSGRVGDTSSFKITIERVVGRILSPNPVINFDDVNSVNNYKVTTTDTFENTTELIKRVFEVTHKVGLKKLKTTDVINIKALSAIDVTGPSNRIYGLELLAKPPGQTLEELSISIASDNTDLTSISIPTFRNINKRRETRLLVVYGDPGATFQLKLQSNVISLVSASANQNSTTVEMGGSNANNGAVNAVDIGMQIVSLSQGSVPTSGTVTTVTDSTNPDKLIFSAAQAVQAATTMGLARVLIAEATKTIGDNGIYFEYVDFPENNTTANLTYTITLTETTSNSFTAFDSPATFSVVSQNTATAHPAYTTSTAQAHQPWLQTIIASPISTGSGTNTAGQAQLDSDNLSA